MTTYAGLDKLVRELQETRFKEFEQRVLRGKALAERDAKLQDGREKRRRDFMTAIGTDPKKLDAATEQETRAQEAELSILLDEFRPKLAGRRSMGAAVAKDAAIRSEVLAESGQLVLPVFASSIFTADKSAFADVGGLEWINGAINSGWVFPDDPSKIRIKDTRHYPNALCWDNRQDPPPEFAAHFTFVPATTATYEMTAVLAFHGFYILRSDDSWWNCRAASVNLKIEMNVHQYSDSGWHETTLINIEKQNADEITSYDRTQFFDYTTGLRAGDPVVVTVKGIVKASAHGGGAYAELNFADGTANYIQPLFVSVQQV